AAATLVLDLGAAPHGRAHDMASARIAASKLPYVPGSHIPLLVDGLEPPYSLEVLGPAAIVRGALAIPSAPNGPSATVIASNRYAMAMHRFDFAPPPSEDRAFIAVAAYDDGIVLHEDRAPYAALSILGIGGAPSDVAIDDNGRIAAGDTSGDSLLVAAMNPWEVREIAGVALSDELAFDPSSHALFATDRDVSGSGALTRITPEGLVTRRLLGLTSEGIAIDSKRHRVYVANANDGTVSIVDATSLAEIRRFHAIDRAFSLALSSDGRRLFVVSNQSLSSLFGSAGRVVAFDVSSDAPHQVARSAALAFPLGISADDERRTLFVTDERDDVVYVLNPLTLQASHRPLATCRTPWKPAVDSSDHRLYIPCAQSDLVDVFDTRSLKRIAGAPFRTGGYPLAVAVWHSNRRVVR
ncbi:MAG: hypothetical protein M3N13_08795, partial [Candidatus Eremiobacteraeota bacterium]|nr:hypothetical protein [Candidatus Eremiobacteraeota bacterium]